MNPEIRADKTALSAEERRIAARGRFNLASIHLAEAMKLARKGGTPNACIHSAYYAMHHCAAAAILISGGVGKRRDAPASHTHVIEHFAKLVAGETGNLAGAGERLSHARTERTTADYGVVVGGANSEDAKELAATAQLFVEACASRWNLQEPQDAMERRTLVQELKRIQRDA